MGGSWHAPGLLSLVTEMGRLAVAEVQPAEHELQRAILPGSSSAGSEEAGQKGQALQQI